MSQNNIRNKSGSAASGRAWAKRFTLQSRQARAVVMGVAFVLYALTFFALNRLIGPSVVGLALLPVAIAGWLQGMRGGLLAAALCFPLNILLLNSAGMSGWTVMTGSGGGASGTVLLFFAGGIAGRMSDLSQQVARELAERKRAEEAHLESEEKFSAAFQSSPLALVITKLDGKFVEANPAFCDLVGYSREEIMGKTVTDLGILSDQNREKLISAAVNAGGSVSNAEVKFRIRDGSLRDILYSLETISIRGTKHLLSTGIDITDRKRAEDERRESEERYRAVTELVSDYAYSYRFNSDGNVELEWVTSAYRRITGYEPSEIRGEGEWKKLIHPEDLVKASEHTEKIFTGRQSIVEYRIITKNREVRWLRDFAQPMLDKESRVVRFVGAAQDITERKQAEEALRRAEENYRSIVENSLNGIFQSTPEGRFIMVNPALARMWGYDSPGDLLASVTDAARQVYVDPDRRAKHTRLLKEQDGSVTGFEYSAYRKDGTTIWVSENVRSVVDSDGTLLYYEGTVEDISERKQAEEKIQRQLEHLTALSVIDQAISASFELQIILNVLLEQVTAQLRVDAAAVLLHKSHLHTLEYAAGRGFRSNAYSRTQVRLGDGQAGKAALERRIVAHPNFTVTSPIFAMPEVMAGESFAAYYAVPLISKGQVKGVLEIFHRTRLDPDEEWLNFLQTLASQAAIAIDNAELFNKLHRSNAELMRAYDATIEGWSRALDLRDKETEGHTQRVTEMTLRLAQAMGQSDEELIQIRRGSLLHDMGKLGIPDNILLKSDELTDEEWVVMKRHPQYAYDMLTPIDYLRHALDIPYCHHEKWDGTGYPRGLKGEEIPLAARIFAVVDVWDALRSDRPYRKGWSEGEVRQHIRQQSGIHFDPQVVNVFLKLGV